MLLVRAAPTRREGVVRAWWGVGAFQAGVQYWVVPNVGPALIAFAVFLGALWLPWGWAVHRFLRPTSARTALAAFAVIPSAWICAEAARSWRSLGGPWAMIGATQWREPAFLASASIGGVWLTSYLVMGCNTAVALAVVAARLNQRRGAAGALVAAAVCLAVGPAWYAIRSAPRTVATARIGIVQTGVEHDNAKRLAVETAATRTLLGQHLDLVVWGESAVDNDPSRIPAINALSGELGADILVNGSVDAPGTNATYNESLLIGPDGALASYAKMRLVPFGEYIPTHMLFGWVADISRAAKVNRLRGSHTVIMSTGGLRIGPLICFESAFPDMSRTEVRQGADILVYESNTSTFQGSWAQPQHASLAAVRAVETGRPAVQTSLSGVSAAFDAEGHELAWKDSSYHGAFVVAVPITSGHTPFEKIGNWPLLAALGVVVSAAAWEVWDYRRSRRSDDASTANGTNPASVTSDTSRVNHTGQASRISPISPISPINDTDAVEARTDLAGEGTGYRPDDAGPADADRNA
jgi:apolipoprotein N-acyltransferase